MPEPASILTPLRPAAESVEAKLHRAWRKERRFVHARGLCHLVLWLTALGVVDFMVDWLFLLPGVVRVALGVANLALLGWVAFDRWLRHLHRYNAVHMALRVERRNPGLNSLLVSYVQVGAEPRPGETISAALIQALRREAILATAPLDFRRIISYRELRQVIVFSSGMLLLSAAASVNWSAYVNTFLDRMVRPASARRYPTRTRIVRLTGHQTVRQGAALTIEVVCADRIPAQGRLLVKSSQGPWETLSLTRVGQAGFDYRVPEVHQDFSYYVRVGDAVSEVYRVQVVPAPKLVKARVRVQYPSYTGLAARDWESLNLEVPEASVLDWALTSDRALRTASILIESSNAFPLSLAAGGREAAFHLGATNPFTYSFNWTELEHGYVYEGGVQYFVNTVPDAAPEVQLLQPAEDEKATVRKKVSLSFRANDDYRVAKAWLVYSLNRADEKKQLLGEGTQATVETNALWNLKGALPELKEGDVLGYAIEVADNRQGPKGPNVTRTRHLQLSIVSSEEYLRYILEKQGKLVKDVEAMQKEEKAASRQVKDLRQTPPPVPNPTNGPAGGAEPRKDGAGVRPPRRAVEPGGSSELVEGWGEAAFRSFLFGPESASPSPQPSGRGSPFGHAGSGSVIHGFPATSNTSPLSPRERVRVRGNGACNDMAWNGGSLALPCQVRAHRI